MDEMYLKNTKTQQQMYCQLTGITTGSYLKNILFQGILQDLTKKIRIVYKSFLLESFLHKY
jgi:hypothetical protein